MDGFYWWSGTQHVFTKKTEMSIDLVEANHGLRSQSSTVSDGRMPSWMVFRIKSNTTPRIKGDLLLKNRLRSHW